MTEKEKLQLAKKYIDYLARGFNPIDESPVNNDDIVRNIRISKCLLYVSEVLAEVIEKGIAEGKSFSYRKPEKIKKEDFNISYDDRKKFIFSDEPLTSTEIAVGLSSIVDSSRYKDLKGVVINEWLAGMGFLIGETDYNGKIRYKNSDDGLSIGITSEQRFSKYNTPYQVVKFTKKAQEFIIDNLDGIIEHNRVRAAMRNADKLEKSYQKSRNKYSGDILDEVIRDLHMAGGTPDDIANVTDQDVRYIEERMRYLKLI